MRRTFSMLASAAFGGFLVLFGTAPAAAQNVAGADGQSLVGRVASFAPGSIGGVVLDEQGRPVGGAMVSALGAMTAFAVTERDGRFELRTLAPGPYLVRAFVSGYVAPRPSLVEVRASARATSSIALRRAVPGPRILTAGVGSLDTDPAPDPPQPTADQPAPDPAQASADDHGETAWRIRHARKGILKDVLIPDEVTADNAPSGVSSPFAPGDFLERAAESSARFATSLFAETPFSGQIDLLTSGTFDGPQDLFSTDTMMRKIANVSLSAPAGDNADWTVRGALTQADISSWTVAGSYRTRAPAVHAFDIGLSYSTQRYTNPAGNAVPLQSLSDGSRNTGALYAFDTFAINPMMSVTYGTRFARYDYVEHRELMSPRVEVALTPSDQFRLNAMISRREIAPGAEEFLAPNENGIWLPPQRTFSSLDPAAPLDAERVTHTAVEAERDFGRSTVTVRAFRQVIDNQLATIFGVNMPNQPAAKLGHYFVSGAGAGQATGCSAAIRAALSGWMKGSIEYTLANAQLTPSDRLQYLVLVAPSAIRPSPDRIHSVATTLETTVPETSTRVLVLYRVGNGFARPGSFEQPGADRSRIDSRFDVQVHQSLPFMDFSSARWEMLIDVRNFFREAGIDQSVYDELLVVHPPKRIVGGLTMHF